MDDALRRQLAALDAQARRRELRAVTPGPGAELVWQGRRSVNFASNDYLGLSQEPRVIEALAAGARRWGAGAPSSRLLAGHTGAHAAFEERFADYKGHEAALLFPTGTQAALGLITALAGREDFCASDELNHACLIDGLRLARVTVGRYRHADPDDAARALANGASARRRFLITESYFSMDGDLAPLAALVEVARRHDAWLIVDDAHATGVLGPDGRGCAAGRALGPRHVATLSTLGKALGLAGGVVSGSRALIDWLVNAARGFVYSTAVPPAVAAAAVRALDLAVHEPWRRARALEVAAAVRNEWARRVGATGTPHSALPTPHSLGPLAFIPCGSERKALDSARFCFDNSLYIPAIRPPTVPAGASRLRIGCSALHSDRQLARLLEVLAALAPRLR